MLKLITGLAIFIIAAVACADSANSTPSPAPSPAPSATSSPSPTPLRTSTVAPVLTVTPPAAESPSVTPYPSPAFIDSTDCSAIARQQLPLTDVTVSDGTHTRTITAEVARTSAEQQQGLMCRPLIPEGTGMLFPFNQPRSGGFWMFNTYAPLDIIFANGDQAVSVMSMTPCPRENGESDQEWRSRCITEAAGYRPDAQYTAALELPKGWLKSQGLTTEDPGALTIEYELLDDN